MNIDDIKENINELIKLQKYKLIFIEEEINNIINNNITEVNKIERILDDLLDIMYNINNENIVNLYQKLCRYYYSINSKNATFYIYLYYKEHAPKDNMNIIFLDIDGVLNSEKYFYTYKEKLKKFNENNFKDNNNLYNIDDLDLLLKWAMLRIDPKKINLLREIIVNTDAKIIITSTWKDLYYFDLVESELRRLGIPIIDETKDNNYNRGAGINDYIKENNIHNFIVIDDEIFSDFNDVIKDRLIKTNFKDGLTSEHVTEAIAKLKTHKRKTF